MRKRTARRVRMPAEGRGSLYRWRVQKEEALAKLRQLELQQRRGEWDEVLMREVQALLHGVRNSLLAVPARLGQRLQLSRQEVAALQDEMRTVLTLMADGERVLPVNAAAEAETAA